MNPGTWLSVHIRSVSSRAPPGRSGVSVLYPDRSPPFLPVPSPDRRFTDRYVFANFAGVTGRDKPSLQRTCSGPTLFVPWHHQSIPLWPTGLRPSLPAPPRGYPLLAVTDLVDQFAGNNKTATDQQPIALTRLPQRPYVNSGPFINPGPLGNIAELHLTQLVSSTCDDSRPAPTWRGPFPAKARSFSLRVMAGTWNRPCRSDHICRLRSLQ